ncbi:hypothetical protein M8C21_031517, partial [Ambrosia artemisiifolia]
TYHELKKLKKLNERLIICHIFLFSLSQKGILGIVTMVVQIRNETLASVMKDPTHGMRQTLNNKWVFDEGLGYTKYKL